MGAPVVFYVVAIALLASAFGVIWIKNTVHAAFSLVAAFGAVAALYLVLNADFVAMAQLLVYAGAIIIMLLFALMLTQRRETVYLGAPAENRSFLAGLVATLLFVAFVRVLVTSPWGSGGYSQSVLGPLLARHGTAFIIGREFFSTFLLPFEVASVLLLMALVAAIVLARRDEPETPERDAVVPRAEEKPAAGRREEPVAAGVRPAQDLGDQNR